jgi:uncharacterized phage protein (TIGR02218 family)
MRALSPAFAAATSGAATTLARCWKLTRRDGAVFGFTDHDRDIAFDGVSFAALTGVSASDLEQTFGFSTGGGEITGALTSEGLAEADLARGVWDDAAVEVFVVDWSNPAARLRVDKGAIGEVKRHGAGFVAELRGEGARFDVERGRRYTAACSAALGDARCGVSLNDPRWRAEAAVVSTDGRALIRASGLAGFEAGLFRAGSLRWMSGANAGVMQDVRDHYLESGDVVIVLWAAAPQPPTAGDAFILTAGCDKSFGACRDRFANVLNFRGFPHMPGNDLLLRVARDGDPNMDGGSLFR